MGERVEMDVFPTPSGLARLIVDVVARDFLAEDEDLDHRPRPPYGEVLMDETTLERHVGRLRQPDEAKLASLEASKHPLLQHALRLA